MTFARTLERQGWWCCSLPGAVVPVTLTSLTTTMKTQSATQVNQQPLVVPEHVTAEIDIVLYTVRWQISTILEPFRLANKSWQWQICMFKQVSNYCFAFGSIVLLQVVCNNDSAIGCIMPTSLGSGGGEGVRFPSGEVLKLGRSAVVLASHSVLGYTNKGELDNGSHD